MSRFVTYRFRRNMRLTASAKHRKASKMRQSNMSLTDGMVVEEDVMCQRILSE